MIYYLILFFLLIGTFLDLKKYKTNKYIYIIVLLMLTVFICFRFGQGTDYLSYYAQYKYIPTRFNTFIQNYKDYHGEFGWLLIVFVSKKIGLSFEIFNLFLSLAMMLALNKALIKFSPLRICSCLLFFPTYYLTYCFSGIRQGFCLCIFLGIGLSLLLNKEYVKYFLLIILLSLIHKSTYLLLLLPFLININLEKHEKYILLIPILSYVFFYLGLFDIFCKAVSISNPYIYIDISVLAIIARLIYIIIIKFLHSKVKQYNNEIEKKLFNIYILGFYMFLGLSFSATLSQRLTMTIKALEVILIPLQLSLMYKYFNENKITKKYKKNISNCKITFIACILIIIFMPIVEFYKNINAYLKQGNYYEKYTTLQYPYITLFNKKKICKYIDKNNTKIREINCDIEE